MNLDIKYKNTYIDDLRYIKALDKKTIKAYEIDLTQFYSFAKRRNIDKNVLHEYLIQLHQTYKPKTVKRKIASLHAFFVYLVDEEFIDANPLLKLKVKFKEPKLLPKTIPVDIIDQLLQYMKDKLNLSMYVIERKILIRDLALLQLLFSTGLRVSEISNLKQSDIHISVSKLLIFGKGAKERILQIEDSVLDSLIIYRNVYHKELEGKKYLFINRLGNRLSDQSIRNMIEKYRKEADIDMHITPHMFRHTFASLLLEEDVDIRYIQHILGHSSITTTQIYTHVTSNKQKEILLHKNPIQKLHLD